MAVIRLIVIFLVLGSITLLLVQNLSPSLPLVFLGMRSRALPMAIWVLLSVVAGVVTSLGISSLFRLSSYMAGAKQQSFTSSNEATSARRPSFYQRQTTNQTASVGVKDSTTQRTSVSSRQTDDNQIDEPPHLNDWEQTASEDWDFDDEPINSHQQSRRDRDFRDTQDTPREEQEQYRDFRDRENTQSRDEEFAEDLFEPDEPETIKNKKPNPDTTYSYNYREPKQTGVGKTESVYDADYRVLVPPYQPESENRQPQPDKRQNSDNTDDWDFLDEFEAEDHENPQPKDR